MITFIPDTPSPCCDAPLEPRALITSCARCGQIYRPDGTPEGSWRYFRYDQDGRMLTPLRSPKLGGQPC
jgi:hypothetical protein